MPRYFDEAHTAANFTAIAVKDRIINELDKVQDSPVDFANKADFILAVLYLTDGLWNDLSYAYKAKEICDKIVENANRLKIQVEESTNNRATLKRLESVRAAASNQSIAFFRLQSDKFCDAMGVTDPKTREIARMTNMELAS
jgi:hypothetical protein